MIETSVHECRKMIKICNDDLPESVRNIIQEYEKEIIKEREIANGIRIRFRYLEKRHRYQQAAIHVLRDVLKNGKHISDMREKLRKKGVSE